jgi:hypothetical protein
MMKRFYYVKCLGDNSWLAKPANARTFKRDIREAAPLTVEEAAALGFREDDAIYPLVPVEDVYPPAPPSYFAQALRLISDGPENSLPLGPDDREPFGGVAFDPLGKAEDVDPEGGYTNGQRADIGRGILAAACFLADKPEATAIHINDINLTEAPEEALTDLVANLMHYCHREGLEWTEDVLKPATMHFEAESRDAEI